MGMFSDLAQLRKQEAEKQQNETEATIAPPDRQPKETAQPSVRPSVRRATKRHPFEFYVDQLQSLEQLAMEERLSGKSGSMSAMVREALDEYLAKRIRG
jgi:hypothetical protein